MIGMQKREQSKFTRANLRKLRAGMSKSQVEEILGPHIGKKVRNQWPQFAWLRNRMMLRARFEGPRRTLSLAILDLLAKPYRLIMIADNRAEREPRNETDHLLRSPRNA